MNTTNERLGVIYFFHNKENDKVYIGRTLNYKHRLSTHFRRIKAGLDSHSFYDDYRKHPENFHYGILEADVLEFDLNDKEKWYINFFDSFRNGYNRTCGGDTPIYVRFSDERNNKISATMKRIYNRA